MANPRFWRIRMKFRAEEELSQRAWERDKVGIWYGNWNEKDLRSALDSDDPCKRLTKVNREHGLDWNVRPAYVNTARRFTQIGPQDWVIVYLQGFLGLAHVCSEVLSSHNHPLNRDGELFKYRKLDGKKRFSLNLLPDAFRVLSFAGRGNVYEPRGAAELVKLLGDANDEVGVTEALNSKSLDEALALLGPTSWESVCESYLIIEHQFVPTGLSTGRTLPAVDIVGRSFTNGQRILAQCKGDREPRYIADEFLKAVDDLSKDDMAFYFAYGGCTGAIPLHVKVLDRDGILKWSKTDKGAKYFHWLFGGRTFTLRASKLRTEVARCRTCECSKRQRHRNSAPQNLQRDSGEQQGSRVRDSSEVD